jgi:hypothetical protein
MLTVIGIALFASALRSAAKACLTINAPSADSIIQVSARIWQVRDRDVSGTSCPGCANSTRRPVHEQARQYLCRRSADRLAIRELVEAYAHCADRRDAKGQMALFTADTHFVVYMNAKDPI